MLVLESTQNLGEYLFKRVDVLIKRLAKGGISLTNNEKEVILRATRLLYEAMNKIAPRFPSGHGLEHMFRVLEICIILHKIHGGDFKKLVLATLFHDILRLEENHAEKSADFARKFLENTEFKSLAIDVANIIREHSYSTSKKALSIESMILQDADRLDALGAIGIARVFSYGAYMNRELYGWQEPKNGGSLAHFYEKILKLPKLMNTETGKKIAERRVKVIISFLEEFIFELDLRDIINYYKEK